MKGKVLGLIGILLISSALGGPANSSAVRNGLNCANAGSSVKVGAKIYRCAKNPYVKPSRNTWTLRGCLTAYAMWKDAKQQYEDLIDIAKLAGTDGQKSLEALQASITDLESTMKDVACKRGA
jgi:hypothetical protein